MAISSIILLIMVSGSLFVQRYVNEWKQLGALAEELNFVHGTVEQVITQAQHVGLAGDSLVCKMDHGVVQLISWADGQMTRQGSPLIRDGLRLENLAITPTLLPTKGQEGILKQRGRSPWYELYLVISDEYGNTDSLRCLIKNEYNYYKYAKK